MNKIKVTKDGPYIISGDIPLDKQEIQVDDEGNSVEYKKLKEYPKQETCGLCRCGKTKNAPYCDGTHTKVKFDGTETASTKPFKEQAEIIEGPSLYMEDVYDLCASGRFCHNKKGRVWQLTESGTNDPEAISQACNCPSGRLVMHRKNGKEIEPEHKQEITLLEDPSKNVSGPIWVKGKILVESASGKTYEIRNRVTLCRCGKSKNKPFCDSCHLEGFKASS